MDAGGQTTAIGALIAAFTVLIGLFAWFVKRIVEKTIPEMAKDFSATLKEVTASFAAEQAAERAACERRHQELLARFDAERECNSHRHEENLGARAAELDAHKETRHAIKELQNEAHLHRALVDQAMRLRAEDLLPPDRGGKPC